MRRFHVAVGVEDIDASVEEYSRRLDARPVLLIPGEYALWRTQEINLSVRYIPGHDTGIRHVGWEDPTAETLSVERDLNGLVWERFSAQDQAQEILANWPEAGYKPEDE